MIDASCFTTLRPCARRTATAGTLFSPLPHLFNLTSSSPPLLPLPLRLSLCSFIPSLTLLPDKELSTVGKFASMIFLSLPIYSHTSFIISLKRRLLFFDFHFAFSVFPPRRYGQLDGVFKRDGDRAAAPVSTALGRHALSPAFSRASLFSRRDSESRSLQVESANSGRRIAVEEIHRPSCQPRRG